MNLEPITGPRCILLQRFCELTGYTEKAVRRKVESGIWPIGVIAQKAPDGHVMIDVLAYDRWVRSTGERQRVAADVES